MKHFVIIFSHAHVKSSDIFIIHKALLEFHSKMLYFPMQLKNENYLETLFNILKSFIQLDRVRVTGWGA